MKRRFEKIIYRCATGIELFVSGVTVIVLIIMSIRLLLSVFDASVLSGSQEVLKSYIERALNIAIGVEFVKMLGKHTPITIIEVLLFALARQMIVEHMTAQSSLLSITAIAALFAIRKYLLRSEDEV